MTGCGSQKASSGSKNLPKLFIATEAAVPAVGAALAPATGGGGPDTAMGLFPGYVIAGTLPDQPTHAPIYLWPSTKPSQADVEKLAAVLGLTGTPQRHAHGWDLKTTTGELRVRDDPRPAVVVRPGRHVGLPVVPGRHRQPRNWRQRRFGCAVAPSRRRRQANGPDEATTKAAAASLLTALGVSGDEQFNSGAPKSYLNVSPTIAGLPTQGIDTNVNVDARGIAAGNGPSPSTNSRRRLPAANGEGCLRFARPRGRNPRSRGTAGRFPADQTASVA